MEIDRLRRIYEQRHIWEEGSIHRYIAGDEYDKICSALGSALEIVLAQRKENKRLRDAIESALETPLGEPMGIIRRQVLHDALQDAGPEPDHAYGLVHKFRRRFLAALARSEDAAIVERK